MTSYRVWLEASYQRSVCALGHGCGCGYGLAVFHLQLRRLLMTRCS